MSDLNSIPELVALSQGKSAIRIPDQQQVPITPRVRRVIDTPQFQRLRQISQLGLVSLVYPGATHSRFEHCLGVYRMALLFARHFALDEDFVRVVSKQDVELFIVTALLHDLAHWPFCHPIEDLKLDSIVEHESLFETLVEDSEIPKLLKNDWDIEVDQVSSLLRGDVTTQPKRILYSMLSGPIDVDKMDYLYRDSLHAGVPYGQNFDQQRLIGSLCLNQAMDGIAITDKGRTAAELMVFARYVMFSEVYWHRAVRSGTAMLQRAFYELRDEIDVAAATRSSESDWKTQISNAAATCKNHAATALLKGTFGERRQLFKRLGQYNCFENETIYRSVAQKPYEWLVKCSDQLARIVAETTGKTFASSEILIDAPPVGLEVQFDIQVKLGHGKFCQLGELSPVVYSLATNQFDDFVKRVRIFAAPQIAEIDSVKQQLDSLLEQAIRATNA